jgi:hypothetical protein
VHGVGHHLVFFGLGLGGQARTTGHGAAAVVGRNAAGHDQAHAAFGTLGVERRHALEAVFDLFQPDVHRAHEHAVGQGGETQVQRREQVGVG